MKIIGLGYQKRVGKDTAAKFLLSHYRQKGVDIRRFSFADDIKGICQAMYSWGGLQGRTYYDDHEDEIEKILPPIGKSPRQIWDNLGQSIHEFCPKVWCEMTFSRMEGDVIVIPSVRRPLEIEYIKKFGGKVYKIERVDAPKSEHPVDHHLDNFQSWDGILKNNGTLKEFYQEVIREVKLG